MRGPESGGEGVRFRRDDERRDSRPEADWGVTDGGPVFDCAWTGIGVGLATTEDVVGVRGGLKLGVTGDVASSACGGCGESDAGAFSCVGVVAELESGGNADPIRE